MTIEIFSADNVKQLTALALELWTDGSFEEELTYYQSILDAENEVCYLAKVEGVYVGFIHVSLRAEYVEGADDLPVAYIEGLYVKPSYQKQCIAQNLVGLAEAWGRKKGCKQVASDTELSNVHSIDFHKKMGFEEVNRVVCFVKGL
jgi:aminoglycoside 6'-N-acetyltransferase I